MQKLLLPQWPTGNRYAALQIAILAPELGPSTQHILLQLAKCVTDAPHAAKYSAQILVVLHPCKSSPTAVPPIWPTGQASKQRTPQLLVLSALMCMPVC